MSTEHRPEVWLRGPLPGVSPLLMPAAHCLMQCREEIEAAASRLTAEQLWTRPGGAASAGFHLRHIVGSLDRLLTYARGAQLDPRDRAGVVRPGDPDGDVGTGAGHTSILQCASQTETLSISAAIL